MERQGSHVHPGLGEENDQKSYIAGLLSGSQHYKSW